MNCAKREKHIKWMDIGVFLMLLAVYTVVTFILFYRQTQGNEQYYHSDMESYILEMQGLNTKYSFPYPVLFKLGALMHLLIGSPGLCIALATTILNCLGVIFLKYYMNREFGGELSFRNAMIVSAVVFSVFFVSMLYMPNEQYLPGLWYKYRGIFSPNPYHNATYLATRPFAIVCFFMFARILTKYERETDWKENIVFGIFLFLTTITKPSFTFVLVPTAGIVMLLRLVRDRFRSFMGAIKLGVCFIPTFCALLYQYLGVFTPAEGEEGGIGFGLARVWGLYSGNIFFSVALAAGFPILVLMFHGRDLKNNTMYRLSWQLFAMSFLQALCLYEKGFRIGDFNFSWGYMHGLFFIFVSSVIMLARDTFFRKKRWWVLGIQWFAYAAHLACGIWYFRGIFRGNLYY